MVGYWNRPDETAKVMTKDGFFRTGDIGIMEPSGMVRIVDRKKDMISVSGFKVFPNEVEDVAMMQGAIVECAAAGQLSAWEHGAKGALALLILLDQFPRNMFRGSPRMFATDPMARAIAAGSIVRGHDAQVDKELRNFFYLPFEHSEDLADQERSVALCKAAGDADSLKWAEIHADIIRRFGRFPHRNAVLGRATTPDEQKFLDDGGFGG